MKRTKRSRAPDESKTPVPKRLMAEVFFDLDGTLAVNTWPDHSIGDPIPETVELLRQYVEDGYVCSIFTSRPEDHRVQIWSWLYSAKLEHLIYRVICDKPYFGLLVDDRSYNPPWLTIPQNKTK